ncbi:MAG TPA: MobF family relaxase [Lacipirellulaceae bacterium]|nr:MobF family relaxase [Lacipirellulaceae bacterium]
METVSLVTQADYYLDRHPALYYVDGVAAIGQWYGPAAAKLGFCGAVTPEQLRRAFAGLSADGLRSLVQVQSGKVRQPAWDLTFSAPKWLSALWCRLDEFHRRWLEDILLRAVKRALDYIDADALNTRRGNQGGRVEAAQGVYVLFLHGTSRALDPQLHVHALAVNLCLRSDGTTGTIRSRDLYWHKMAAGALFRAELAHLLATELGLTIVPDGWKFKIAGVPDSLCEEFSQRRKKIELLAKEEGWSSAAALAKLGDDLTGWQVVHQTGDGQHQETEARYAKHGVRALTVTHIDEIASVLFASDVVVCRAGGTMLAELALAGVPAVLCPFPQATDEHQLANAKVFAAAGACRMIDESQQTGALDAALARDLGALVGDQRLRLDMAANMRKLARPHAAAEVAGAIADQLCGGLSLLQAA